VVGVAIKSEQMLVKPWPEQLEQLSWLCSIMSSKQCMQEQSM